MRRTASVFLATFLLTLGCGAAFADYASSQGWFLALTEAERTDIQRGLVLTGDYASLIDGKFGPGTFHAIADYQHRKGLPSTGQLTPDQNAVLQAEAGAIFQKFGFDLVKDEKAGIALAVPLAFLPTKSALDRGSSYASLDQGVMLETLNSPKAGTRFADLFSELTAPTPGKVISYKTFSDLFLVVSGYQGNRRFYVLYQDAQIESVGYRVSWDSAHDAQGSMIAVLAASYSMPIGLLPAEPEPAEVGPDPAGSIRYGSFVLLKDYPTVIALDGDIGPTSEADFQRAMQARPNTNLVVLNSNGGQVSTALMIAQDIAAAHLNTAIPEGLACYSACAYLFFAGDARHDEGLLGVHQIYGDGLDSSAAQSTLSIVLDILHEFSVSQGVISVMLSTPPSDMHVFSQEEVAALDINRGIKVTIVPTPAAASVPVGGPLATAGGATTQMQDGSPTSVATPVDLGL